MKKNHFFATALVALYVAVSFSAVYAQTAGPVGATCTVNGQSGTWVQGGAARDYAIYCFTSGGSTSATTNTTSQTQTTQGTGALPASSISGDGLCGSSAATECNLDHFKSIVSSLLTLFITVGSILLIVFIVFRLVVSWFAFRMGKASAIKEAVNQSWQATIGFFIIFAIFGGVLVAILKSFGVQNFVLRLFSEGLITHAYAQTTASTSLLPNPTTINNAVDLVLAIVRLVVRWFIYPALAFMWLWSGFSYVAAQGKPEEIKKAHSYLMWAAIITVAVVMVQGLIFAIRGTVQQILPQQAASQTASQTSLTPYAGATGNAAFNSCIASGGGVAECNILSANSATNNGATTACTLGATCMAGTQPGTCVQGGASRDYAIYCSPNSGLTPTATPACTVGATCMVGTQSGTCVQGGSAMDYAVYCSANSGSTSSGSSGGSTVQSTCLNIATMTTIAGTIVNGVCVPAGSAATAATTNPTWTDSCLQTSTQLYNQCTTSVGESGRCLFNISTNKFTCVKFNG
jgi:hypothetical protein